MRSRLTYANVMSSIAVFLLLGGVAWAASLPKNSVGTKQLKKNAVTTAKVDDGSLTAADLAAGSRPAAGPAGAKGDPGAPGAKGDVGPAGSKGDTGAPPCLRLLCPNTELAGKAQITIDGHSLVDDITGFETECENAACKFWIVRKTNRNIELAAWHELVVLGDLAAAKKSVSITVYDEGGDPVMRFHGTDAHPIALWYTRNREMAQFTTAFLQRVSI